MLTNYVYAAKVLKIEIGSRNALTFQNWSAGSASLTGENSVKLGVTLNSVSPATKAAVPNFSPKPFVANIA